MEKIYSYELGKEDQVAERFYKYRHCSSTRKTSKIKFLIISLLISAFFYMIFLAEGHSPYTLVIFIPPIFMFVYFSWWLDWRMSVAGYLDKFDNLKIVLSIRESDITVSFESAIKNKIMKDFSLKDIRKLLTGKDFIVLIFDDDAELIPLKIKDGNLPDDLISCIKCYSPNLIAVNVGKKRGIHILGL